MPNFEARTGQIDMALEVTHAFNNREIAILEAGTGTGKSLAYLVPSTMWSLKNNAKVSIATFTITLQSQLVNDDIPILQQAGLDFEYALMKGRSNYICRRKFEDALARNEKDPVLRTLEEYIENTTDGTRSDIPFPVETEIWEEINSDSEQTLRAKCPHFDKCFYYQHRRNAARANLLIINHHLLLADILVKADTGGDGILPKFERLVLDEGHHLEDSATSLMRAQLSSRAIRNAVAPLMNTKRRPGALESISHYYLGPNSLLPPRQKERAFDAIDEIALFTKEIQRSANDWFKNIHDQSLPDLEGTKRIKHKHTQQPEWTDWIKPQLDLAETHLSRLSNRLQKLSDIVSEVPETLLTQHPQPNMDLTRSYRRVLGHAGFLKQFLHCEDAESADTETDMVRWIERTTLRGKKGERTKTAKLCMSPIDVAPLIREQLLMKIPAMATCSATMTVNQEFDHYKRQIGLDAPNAALKVRTTILPTPFNYREQSLLAVATDLPDPNNPNYLAHIGPYIEQCIHISKGGVFVLCTSYRAVQTLYNHCQAILGQRYNLFKQGEMGRTQLLQAFVQTPRSVLFGADSFWEGVSVPGDDLKMVVIPKLPFRVPSEPVQQARHERIVANGGNPFEEYSLPQAALRLRQGVGRLIRTQRDKGSVVILDHRVTRRRYGEYFLRSLPDMQRIQMAANPMLYALNDFHNPNSTPLG
jgi:ATP-dependent DNA helicase DinG